eukprot:c47727_g1_i1 orf=195-1223(+)
MSNLSMAGPSEPQVSIPPFFRCPISLDLMRDPVSVCTGVTYDRASIEKWIDSGNNTCPATMQTLQSYDLIPNHTLRRLIQDWCEANRAHGVERIPTPKSPADPFRVKRLLHDISNGYSELEALKELRKLAKENIRNSGCIVENGAPAVLAAFLACHCLVSWDDQLSQTYCDEALGTLVLLPLNEQSKFVFVDPDHLAALAFLLHRGNFQIKVNALTVLERVVSDERVQAQAGAVDGLLQGIVNILMQSRSTKAVKICLKTLYAINHFKKNRAKTVETEIVPFLIEKLVDVDKGSTELYLALLEELCHCAEGRSAVREHALAIPLIVKKLLRASDLATEHAQW